MYKEHPATTDKTTDSDTVLWEMAKQETDSIKQNGQQIEELFVKTSTQTFEKVNQE